MWESCTNRKFLFTNQETVKVISFSYIAHQKKKKTLKVNFCMLRAENLGYTGLQQAKNVVLSF